MDNEKIDRFVRDEMSVDERQAFKKLMDQNEDLQNEVNFGNELKSFFDNREPALESQLEKLGEEHFADKPSSITKYWWIPVALALLGGLWYMTQSSNQTPIPQPKVEAIESVSTTETASKVTEGAPAMPEEVQQAQDPIVQPPKPIKKIETQPAQPIAELDPADFAPNPILESLMKEQVRDSGFETKVIGPTPSQIFIYKEKILLDFKGNTTAKPPYDFTIYSNKGQDFDEGIGVLSKELTGTRDGDTYTFRFNAAVPFERGLYYILLQEKAGEEILRIEQFMVK